MVGRVRYLGEFEQVVLLAVARLDEDAHGASIRREIERRAGRTVTMGATYATLDRLVKKGYLRARDPHPAPDRRGRAHRVFVLTAAGIAALEAARDLQARMWAGLHLRRAAEDE